jgi:hypothetical protein
LGPRDRVDPIDKHVGNSFQQVQKYEKGVNRIGAGRLQHISSILQVPSSSTPGGAGPSAGDEEVRAVSPQYIYDFLATADGLTLAKSFSRIQNRKLRSAIVQLVEQSRRIKYGCCLCWHLASRFVPVSREEVSNTSLLCASGG